VDEIIIFHALTKEHLKEIVDIQLHQVQKRLTERHIELELTEAAKEFLIEAGYDPVYGARPLKRTIQQKILDPLAVSVLSGEFHEGDVVHVDKYGDSLVFRSRIEAELVA
jgi:ATP-dependent Clp protease ATP-binding subunit ClpA